MFKDPKLHDKKRQTSFCQRASFGIIKYIYKVIYFYLTPLLVILMSFIGYNYWEIQTRIDNKDLV